MNKSKEFIEKVTVTQGMANAGRGDVVATCKCGMKIPKYPGRYPKICPQCDAEIVYPSVNKGTDDVEESEEPFVIGKTVWRKVKQ